MIFDLHNDLPTAVSPRELLKKADKLKATVVYAFWTTELNLPDTFVIKGAAKLTGAGKLFAVEDCGPLSEDAFNKICDLKPVYCSLTHNKENKLAGGALSSGELTKLGKAAIKTLNKKGIPFDTAHLNAKSFYKAADVAEQIINSHTGVNEFCANPRNLTHEQIKIIIQKNGIIGLTPVKSFIGGDTATDFAETIDRFVQKYGHYNVAIGTDFYGTEPLKNLTDYSGFAAIKNYLINSGYSAKSVHDIFFNNAYKYISIRRTNK